MTLPTSTSITYKNPELAEADHPGSIVELQYGFGPLPSQLKNKKIFFFDIDNCLYQRLTKIHDLMQVKIHQYFKDHLQLNDDDAHNLHMNYYKTYGLALEGLVRNHQVDALEYNAKVDDSLDLSSVLNYEPELREMLQRIRESGEFDIFWLVTNAYKNHALRVISFLGLGDLFDGLTYCDYSLFPIVCKPMDLFYYKCLETVNLDKENKEAMALLHFVDDSEINVKAAHKLGFGRVFHYVEIDKEYEALKKKPDFEEFYGKGDNSDKSKISILRNILELESVV
ncbi:CIC11C00000002888 [Sungouiella intermedia]|uniref:CIC11C00000002888 n=1 Tax=Sungouiella intermedia TaxID=45354 RepID=A0A1L0BAZ4_9ASCO|nr:CIC11C00000002888 [[Candida] intermedia]